MRKRIILCVLTVLLISLAAGCGQIGYDVQDRETSPMVITAPPDTPEPQATPAVEASPAPSVTPSPSPTPEPLDLPAIVGQYLGGVPALILTEGVTAGTAAPGETFAVALEENTSTGYLWRWEMGDPAVTGVLDTHYQPETEDAMVGVPGTHIWGFTISEPGEYTLDFTLVAPDGGVGNVQSMTVTVE